MGKLGKCKRHPIRLGRRDALSVLIHRLHFVTEFRSEAPMSSSATDDAAEEAPTVRSCDSPALHAADSEEAAEDDPAEVSGSEDAAPPEEAPDPESEPSALEERPPSAANDVWSAEDVGAEYGDDAAADGAARPDSAADMFESEQDTATKSATRLPISKIKKIMKFDPDVTMANQDAVFLVAKATEMFIEGLVKHAGNCTTRGKRKTVQKRDIEFAVDAVNNFAFLEGVLETM